MNAVLKGRIGSRLDADSSISSPNWAHASNGQLSFAFAPNSVISRCDPLDRVENDCEPSTYAPIIAHPRVYYAHLGDRKPKTARLKDRGLWRLRDDWQEIWTDTETDDWRTLARALTV